MSEEISPKTKKKKAVAAAEPVVKVAAKEAVPEVVEATERETVVVEAPVEVAPEPVAEEVKAEEAVIEERLAEEPTREVISVDVGDTSTEEAKAEAETYIEKVEADACEKTEEVLKEEVKPVEAPKAKLTGAAALVATYKDASLTEEKASDKETPDAVVAKPVLPKLDIKDVDVLELALEGVVEGFLFDAPTKGTERAIRNAVHNTLIQFDHQVAVKSFAVKFDKGTLEVKVSFIRSADNKQVDYAFLIQKA